MKTIEEIFKGQRPYLARGEVLAIMRECGWGKHTMERWMAEGVIQRAPVGGKWARYSRDALRALLELPQHAVRDRR
jgi:hypothetical protein